MKLKFNILYLLILFLLVIPGVLWALESAPDIRRTMMKPMLERIERIEQDITQSIDSSNTDASKLRRLIDAMRELARTDEQLATILRSFSLL